MMNQFKNLLTSPVSGCDGQCFPILSIEYRFLLLIGSSEDKTRWGSNIENQAR